MSTQLDPDPAFERRASGFLLDVLIRAGLVLALAVLCFQVFSPFLNLMTWALILAVTLYPAAQSLAAGWGRQGLAATLIVLLGIVVVVVPTAALMNSLGDSVQGLIKTCRTTRSRCRRRERASPSGRWSATAARLLDQGPYRSAGAGAEPAAEDRRPGRGGARFRGRHRRRAAAVPRLPRRRRNHDGLRRVGRARDPLDLPEDHRRNARGAEFVDLSTATIRAVAKGVLGVAFLQAIIVGVCLLIAGVPWAGVLAVIVLVFGIAQVPALIVTLPAIAYLWSGGDYGTGAAVLYTVLLLVAGMADNVLKPLMLGRGVDAPMPVILLGALGGMAAGGILGMFVGATLLALGYQILMGWVATDPDVK